MISILKKLQNNSSAWRSHAFLIKTNLKGDFSEIVKVIQNHLTEHELVLFDSEEDLFSVDEVRQVQKSLIVKPIKPRVVLLNARKLTIVSQNAMLKLLEDPYDKTTIIVCVSKDNQILPTLKSRVQTIDLELTDHDPTIDSFHNSNLPDQLTLWEQIKENDLLGLLLSNQIRLLINKGDKADTDQLKEITKLYQSWQSGVLAPKYVYEAFCLLRAKSD